MSALDQLSSQERFLSFDESSNTNKGIRTRETPVGSVGTTPTHSRRNSAHSHADETPSRAPFTSSSAFSPIRVTSPLPVRSQTGGDHDHDAQGTDHDRTATFALSSMEAEKADQSSSPSSSVTSPSGPNNGSKSNAPKPLVLPPGVSQQTRHARRIYVGNIPPAYADDDALRAFLNSVISKGLGEENDSSYVLSLYVNQKKCFAFVELKSIELTTACLELDGIIYHSSVLRILRANEYKPELLPPSYNPAMKLHLPASSFGSPPPSVSSAMSSAQHSPTVLSSDPRLDYSYIQLCPVGAVEKGAVAVIGFPYDESIRRTTGRAGCSIGPKAVRNAIRRVGGAGSLVNPELGIDLRCIQVVDVGDIPPGLHIDEACSRLASAIIELVHRGAIPFVLGGSSDQSYCVAAGLMAVTGVSIGAINVSSHLDVRHVSGAGSDSKIHSNGTSFRQLLDDSRFCVPTHTHRNGNGSSSSNSHNSSSCEGRLIMFGTQGALCSADHASYVTDRGGRIYWLSKDLRLSSPLHSNTAAASSSSPLSSTQTSGKTSSANSNGSTSGNTNTESNGCSSSRSSRSSTTDTTTVVQKFGKVLHTVGEDAVSNPYHSIQRPIQITINAGAICGTHFPGSVRASETSLGLTADEILDIALVAGADPNVAVIDLSDFVPEIEEDRSARLYADIFYRFVAGVAHRHADSLTSLSLPASTAAYMASSSSSSSSLSAAAAAAGRGNVIFTNISNNSMSNTPYSNIPPPPSSHMQPRNIIPLQQQQQQQPRYNQQQQLAQHQQQTAAQSQQHHQQQQQLMNNNNNAAAASASRPVPVRTVVMNMNPSYTDPSSSSGSSVSGHGPGTMAFDHNATVFSRTSTPMMYAPPEYNHGGGVSGPGSVGLVGVDVSSSSSSSSMLGAAADIMGPPAYHIQNLNNNYHNHQNHQNANVLVSSSIGSSFFEQRPVQTNMRNYLSGGNGTSDNQGSTNSINNTAARMNPGSSQQQQQQQAAAIGSAAAASGDARMRLAAQLGRSMSASPFLRSNNDAAISRMGGGGRPVSSLSGTMTGFMDGMMMSYDDIDLAMAQQRLKTASSLDAVDMSLTYNTPRSSGGGAFDSVGNNNPLVGGNNNNPFQYGVAGMTAATGPIPSSSQMIQMQQQQQQQQQQMLSPGSVGGGLEWSHISHVSSGTGGGGGGGNSFSSYGYASSSSGSATPTHEDGCGSSSSNGGNGGGHPLQISASIAAALAADSTDNMYSDDGPWGGHN